MNPDEKEDCECAAPQAQTSPESGADRWARRQERVGDAGHVGSVASSPLLAARELRVFSENI